ncbi:Pimeloyl-ACP methyl ester carboxylesterase [Agrococcus jejuensis]|uniref:Pimeloyl-ACP methyl ester carboxylesterase n=2 Tax=Agrococcus jejuensis TaxID=399736 RepID=A0A1G8EYX7_9MICO|nr:Pimeloyl-ACP methyl ester carboxylesterase [Agrococcus jejuensis]
MRVLRGADEGAGVPVLLVHGGGYDAAGISWFRLVEALAPSRPVVAPDLPGFGGTEGIEPIGDADALADLLAELLDALALPRVVVIGVSMGGDVALRLALRHPDAVASLVAIAPGGLVARVGGSALHALAWAGTRLPDALLRPLTRAAGRFAGATIRGFVSDPATLPPEVVAEFAAEGRAPGSGLAYGAYNRWAIARRGMPHHLRDRVAGIRAPTLLVHGTADPMVPIEGSRLAADRIPHATLVALPGVGHWAQLEAHDAVREALAPALAAADASR